MAKQKNCKRCGTQKDVLEFREFDGTPKPRGWFCFECNRAQHQEDERAQLEREAGHPAKLEIIYGAWWRHFANPSDFLLTLYHERSACPYCGTALPPHYVPAARGKVPRSHLDHMDPLRLGGEESIRNTVFICGTCSLRKRKRRFIDWLSTLNPEFQASSRLIYVEKHGHEPEAFVEGEPTERDVGVSVELDWTEAELRAEYPKPIVDGPPKDIVITIRLPPGTTLD